MKYYVYIITNKPKNVLYIGKTGKLKKRLDQHKNKVHPTTFSIRYNLDKNVYFEGYQTEDKAKFKRKADEKME